MESGGAPAIPFLVLSKLYANAMMTTLNTRAYKHTETPSVNIQRRSSMILQPRNQGNKPNEHTSSLIRSNSADTASEETK
ncbi:hypothetical protein DAEQUDRAFT_734107 [Daedalea quercina L-15889]|uniref:Uncharacterized protein n=1 Tax=Daedalea quercina L-15889 TaxID=1314783 RepID=A0A165KIC8_9APHY|nr:hypothetical protein DAEQUDRAFT_734107 [Daedalea quercina L-15889]